MPTSVFCTVPFWCFPRHSAGLCPTSTSRPRGLTFWVDWSSRSSWGANLPIWFTMPRNRCNSVTFSGAVNLDIAATFEGSAWIPPSSTMKPRNLVLVIDNSHLSFNGMPLRWILSITSSTRWSCSSLVVAWISTSSMWQITPGTPSRILFIVRWKMSGAELIPSDESRISHTVLWTWWEVATRNPAESARSPNLHRVWWSIAHCLTWPNCHPLSSWDEIFSLDRLVELC